MSRRKKSASKTNNKPNKRARKVILTDLASPAADVKGGSFFDWLASGAKSAYDSTRGCFGLEWTTVEAGVEGYKAQSDGSGCTGPNITFGRG